MNTKTKSKGEPMTDVCSKNSVSVFVNGSVEVSHTGSKFILIVFDNDLPNKSIFVGDVDNAIDIPNGTILAQISNNLLPDGGANSLIST